MVTSCSSDWNGEEGGIKLKVAVCMWNVCVRVCVGERERECERDGLGETKIPSPSINAKGNEREKCSPLYTHTIYKTVPQNK